MLRLAYLLVFAVSAGGCSLWFGDDTGDDCTALDTGGAEAPLATLSLRDPSTLQCQDFGGGYCPDPSCPCADPPADPVPIPTWGSCYSACEGLDEATCRSATECRAGYDYACYTGDGPCTSEVPYIGCFATDMQGPISGGSCDALDATTCSMHNDCVALHTQQCSSAGCIWQFIACGAEDPCVPIPCPAS